VAGLDEVLRHGGRRRQNLDGPGAVGGADARGHALCGVHAHLEIGAETFAVLAHHAFDAELLQALGRRRHANQPAAELGHEIHGGGSDELASEDQIAFIFAVGVIHDDDHPAPADVGHDGFNAVELVFHFSPSA